MPISIDAISSSFDAADPTSLTFSHTCSGNNRLLVVGVSVESDSSGHTTQTVSGITYNSIALTKIRSDYILDNGCELWYLIAPAIGSNSIVITFTGVVDGIGAGAISFNGADQTAPIEANNGATAEPSSTVSANVTSLSYGAWLVEVTQGAGSADVITPNSGQTEHYQVSVTGDNRIEGSTKPTGNPGVYTMGSSISVSSGLTLSAAAIKPAAGGSLAALGVG